MQRGMKKFGKKPGDTKWPPFGPASAVLRADKADIGSSEPGAIRT